MIWNRYKTSLGSRDFLCVTELNPLGPMILHPAHPIPSTNRVQQCRLTRKNRNKFAQITKNSGFCTFSGWLGSSLALLGRLRELPSTPKQSLYWGPLEKDSVSGNPSFFVKYKMRLALSKLSQDVQSPFPTLSCQYGNQHTFWEITKRKVFAHLETSA